MPQIPFNVDAYAAKLFGRENVSKIDGAILELVKNTYDADASICFLYYEQTTNTLYIGDNGTGMTKDVILRHWMTIGNSSKSSIIKTRKGRIQTGAKGIGRFALDRIADNCTMLTISEAEHLLWTVDWSSFASGQYITDITASLEEINIPFDVFIKNTINPAVIDLIKEKYQTTGTIFKLTNLRDEWDIDLLKNIKLNLQTLIPPEFKEIFNIYLFEENTSLYDAELLRESNAFPFDYKINFTAFTDGKVLVKIYRDEFDFGIYFDKILTEAGFTTEDRKYFNGTPIEYQYTFSNLIGGKNPIENTIGNFSGTLYFAKLSAPKEERQKYYYKDITGRPDIRDSFGGIRIYRDGFRVRPYGDPNTSSYDWLMLAKRKNQSPAAVSHESGAWRVNADQIHGSLFISKTNLTLIDQANRQGFIETKEYGILCEFIINIIKIFERDRQSVCRILNHYYEATHKNAKFENEIKQKAAEEERREKKTNSILEQDTPNALVNVKKVARLLDEKRTTIEELENEIQMLRTLATTGIVTNTYVHEIKALTHTLNMKIVLAKESLAFDHNIDEAIKQLEIANKLRNTFTSWFKITIESVKKDKRTKKKTNISVLLSDLILAWQSVLNPQNITIIFSGENVIFKCFPYEIESIINNLIANSAAAFDRSRSNDKTISIKLQQTTSGICIVYDDSGPGLSNIYKKNPHLILESFETDKKSNTGESIGTGMGMWIISRIITDYKGSIDLSKNITSDKGFHIILTLKEKNNEE